MHAVTHCQTAPAPRTTLIRSTSEYSLVVSLSPETGDAMDTGQLDEAQKYRTRSQAHFSQVYGVICTVLATLGTPASFRAKSIQYPGRAMPGSLGTLTV